MLTLYGKTKSFPKNNCYLFEKTSDGDVLNGRHILNELVSGLDVLDRHGHALGQFEGVEVDLEPAVQVAHLRVNVLDDAVTGLW